MVAAARARRNPAASAGRSLMMPWSSKTIVNKIAVAAATLKSEQRNGLDLQFLFAAAWCRSSPAPSSPILSRETRVPAVEGYRKARGRTLPARHQPIEQKRYGAEQPRMASHVGAAQQPEPK